MTSHPCELTAGEAASAIRAGSLSPIDLIDSLFERIDALGGAIQAFCFVDRSEARRQAIELSLEAARGFSRGLLHGVPFAAKDVLYTRGVPTEAGSALLKGFSPKFDATAVDRLRTAGAILIGKTCTAEFAYMDPAPTCNPWNLAHTPGGSSSGSAAAVAARMVPLALGTQTGGSILRPAAYCGNVGLKPSFGRVSLHGVVPLTWCMDHVGFIGRCVGDVALALQAAAGFDPADASSVDLPVPNYLTELGAPKRPTLGVLRDTLFWEVDSEVKHATNNAIETLFKSGASINEVRMPASFAVIHAAQHVIEEAEIADVHSNYYAAHSALYRPLMRQSIERGMLVPSDVYIRAQRIRRQFRRDIVEILKSFDALIMPTTATTAPKGLSSVQDCKFQSPWSAIGLPSVSIPCGLSGPGLPIGLQLVGSPFAESTVLSASAWCERHLDKLCAPPAQ